MTSGPAGALHQQFLRSVRNLEDRIDRLLLRDGADEPLPVVLVAGSPRSGTTWIGEMTAAATRSRLIFEPLAPAAGPRPADLPVFPYLAASAPAEAFRRYLESVFGGRVRDNWLDTRPMNPRPRGRVVKSVRACLCLGWLAEKFADVPVVFVVRDPRSVVRSRMRMGWAPSADLAAIVSQPKLMDRLGPLADPVRRLTGRAESCSGPGTLPNIEANAAIWAVHTHVALADLLPERSVVVGYEALLAAPERGFGELFHRLGVLADFDLEMSGRTLRRADRIAATGAAAPGPAAPQAFRDEFGPEGERSVVRHAEMFGLGWTLQAEDGTLSAPGGTSAPSNFLSISEPS